MPRDSNGVASTDPVYLAVTGETIRAVQHNTPIEDIISMLTGSLARNGTGGMQADLVMGGFKITGIANATLSTDAMAFGQFSAELTTALAAGVSTSEFTGAFSRSGIMTPAQITADQNDYAPTQASAPTTLDTAATLRISSNAARTITGLIAPATNANGREIRIVNIGSFALTLANESASSTASNRFTLPSDTVVPTKGSVDLIYDGTSSRWIAIGAAKTTSMSLPGSPTTTTQAGSDNSTNIATTAQVHAAINNDLNASGSAPKYACRAWVNFNGTGTVAIRSSGNVSSITDDGTGLYTVNFATALADANYSVNVSAVAYASATTNQPKVNINGTAASGASIMTSSALQIQYASDSTRYDASLICVSVFR